VDDLIDFCQRVQFGLSFFLFSHCVSMECGFYVCGSSIGMG
jgi:hypothetical protein